jgi:uncharacterized protein (TIGR00299 family) protein
MHANTTLHFDIVSGIAGDMSLAVLCGLGLDLVQIQQMVKSLTDKDIQITAEDTFVNGIASKRLKIDMPHEHAHRKMSDIREMITNANLPEQVITDAIGIFEIIAKAEGEIHGKSAEDVHFHEVGALDSIIDIVGFAYGKHLLDINNITSSQPVFGTGMVKCVHGKVPVPAPATLKILEGVNVKRTEEPNELTTPTGAAILKYYVKEFSPAFSGEVIASAHSTGTKTLETMSNILRGTLIKSAKSAEQITVAETNIDDCSGEVIGQLFTELKDVSIDVFCTQTIGKKNRPAMLVTVLCKNDQLKDVAAKLFAHTSTAGIRHYTTDRIIMDRSFVNTEIDGQKISVKKLSYENTVKYSPEWDDCVKASMETGNSAMAIYDKAKAKLIL